MIFASRRADEHVVLRAIYPYLVTMTAKERVDAHWHLQADLLNMPSIDLNLIGRIEFFANFMRVVVHAQASDALRIG